MAEGEDALSGARAGRVAAAFERSGAGAGILHLGAAEVGTELPPAFGYFRELGHELIARVCACPELEALGDLHRLYVQSSTRSDRIRAK